MKRWHEYERLKDKLKARLLTAEEYEQAIKELVKELRL